MIRAGTLSDLEECLAAEFAALFSRMTFSNSVGKKVPLKSFVHALPVRQGYDGYDSPVDDDDLPEPYIIAEVTGGKQASPDDAHLVTAAAVVCVCDDDTARQGHKDILTIIHRIIERFDKNPLLVGKFVFRHPLEWTLSDEDTYPYYYGGLLLTFEVPAIQREDPLA